ncbi:DNA polymerase III subunit delta' [Ventosimonas gracilis]|uniref:DNA polymerase III subunit delta' n=1 Tax=Ventosimonas gracilis TaxID=1680762 RepID=A0A139SPE3_9GAMM|nr:DNA polymerase III subunit delta' [Ventosimonas gracilis]KXU36321.1 DNA polymerase III subunit delta' [Ventosimonas gracilis]
MTEIYPWQQSLWQQLTRRQQLAHAFLLHGAAGIGKRALADALLAHWLTQGQAASAVQKSKNLLAAGTHPDVFVLEPEESGKAIKIDQVRELVAFAGHTAQMGARKLILLEPAEAMNPSAANALLKTLEEPSEGTILLLISHQPSQLLPTLKSRCVQLPCPQPNAQSALTWLMQSLPQLTQTDCRELLQLAAGSPLAARRLHEQDVRAQRQKVVTGCKQLFKREQSAGSLAESWNAIPLLLLLDWFCEWAQQTLRQQLGDDSCTTADMQPVLIWLASRAKPEKLLAFYDWLLDKRRAVLAQSPLNRTLLLESLLVQWAQLA